ncbi:MAG: hypothetical protein JSW10_05220 [Pseudomonadota bacterium]|nr:MAG: hypothetical protein JSW10_05220 [Pseudomonadota bacterium]
MRSATASDSIQPVFPPLPIDEWEETKNTLHLYLQIVGKVRMALMPKMNHWWHVPLYVSPCGLTTHLIPYRDGCFEIELDLINHELAVRSSSGAVQGFALEGQSVAQFLRQLFEALRKLSIYATIRPFPYDVPFSTIPFAEDERHAAWDADYVTRFWRILLGVNGVFEIFRGRYLGKSTSVHLFWHHMDLALTRFSGHAAPYDGGTAADREAYSHEVISFGFWAGDAQVREPAFYAYAYPEPKGLGSVALHPDAAYWTTAPGFTMAYLSYEAVRAANSPREAILEFLDSTWQGAANLAGWDVPALTMP